MACSMGGLRPAPSPGIGLPFAASSFGTGPLLCATVLTVHRLLAVRQQQLKPESKSAPMTKSGAAPLLTAKIIPVLNFLYAHRPLLLALAVGVSLLLPGVAHLRLGRVRIGLAYLVVLAAINVAQFGAPFLEPHIATAALISGVAFGLGWVLSAAAAQSAARLVLAD